MLSVAAVRRIADSREGFLIRQPARFGWCYHAVAPGSASAVCGFTPRFGFESAMRHPNAGVSCPQCVTQLRRAGVEA